MILVTHEADRKPKAELLVVHGTRNAYERFGCRCDPCVAHVEREPKRLAR